MKSAPLRQDLYWSEAVLEACWLMAAVLIPLFFNPYSQRIFEPDKIALLRSLATLTLAGWGVKLLVHCRISAKILARPLSHESKIGQNRYCAVGMILAAVFFLTVSVISALTSIMPRISWLGSYERMDGALTTASYIVLFFSIVFALRRKEQLDRFVTCIILPSLPIALYGVLQHFFLDPLQFPKPVTERCTSTAGNPSFLGGYLIMVVPLTLSRLASSWKKLTGDSDLSDCLRGILLCVISTTVLVTAVILLVLDVSPVQTWIFISCALALQVPLYAGIPSKRFGTVFYLALPLIFSCSFLAFCLLDLSFSARGSWYFWAAAVTTAVFFLIMTGLASSLGRNSIDALVTSAYATILIIQLSCLLFTQSRGAILAFLASMVFFLIVWGLIARKIWVSWTTIGLILCGTVLISLLAGNDSHLIRQARSIPGLHRLTRYTYDATIQVRKFIWQGVGELLTSPSPFTYQDDAGETQSDVWHAIRPALGYGPETFGLVFPAVHPPELLKLEHHGKPDRAHNVFLNELITRGWLGTISFLVLFTTVLSCGLRCLIPDWLRSGRLFLSLWSMGGLAGAILTWITYNPLLLGLGVPSGLLLGLAAFILICLLLQTFAKAKTRAPNSSHPLIPLALLAALVAHFIETQFGFAVAATALYFWIFSSLIAALALRPQLQEVQAKHAIPPDHVQNMSRLEGEQSPGAGYAPEPARTLLHALGIILLVILVTILFEMLPSPVVRVLESGRSPTDTGWNWAAFLVLVGTTWLLSGILFLQHRFSNGAVQPGPSPLRAGLVLLFFSFTGALLFTVLHSCVLQFAFGQPSFLPHITTFYFAVVSALAFLLALALRKADVTESFKATEHPLQAKKSLELLPLLLFAAALLAIYTIHLRPIHADTYYRYAVGLQKLGRIQDSIPFLEKSHFLSPQRSNYLTALGHTYLNLAVKHHGNERVLWFAKAEKALKKVLAGNPIDPQHHVNMADLYTTWARQSHGSGQRELFKRAWKSYERAVFMKPKDHELLSAWAKSLLAGGRTDQAKDLLHNALALFPDLKALLQLGEIYLQQEEWEQARDIYQLAAEQGPRSVEAFSGLGYALAKTGLLEEALHVYQKAIALSPESYNDYKNLALVYKDLGRTEQAIQSLKQAIAFAPEEKKNALRPALEELTKRDQP
jgi:tetratricopeptide (TPR) repeat protein